MKTMNQDDGDDNGGDSSNSPGHAEQIKAPAAPTPNASQNKVVFTSADDGAGCRRVFGRAKLVLPSINNMIQRWRQMQTPPLTLPDGTTSFPGQSMKPYAFYLKELTSQEEDATKVLDHNSLLLGLKLLTGSTRLKMNRKAASNRDEIPSGGGGVNNNNNNNNNNKGTLADCANAVSSSGDKAEEGGTNTTMREGC
ncbi:hypothetical protein QIS74_11473 [Colletotrichum tabaci]|uniref:Uncharacterized protein n=1 Tax=Colletotrichum tabaci TaxID=1209068 RepID=A0AAV9SZC0_9PEZI